MFKILKNMLITIIIVLILYFVIFHLFGLKTVIMKRMYPREYSEYVYKYSKEYDVDELLVFSIIKAESNFQPDVTSSSNAMGLMQLMENTAVELSNIIDGNYIEKEEIYSPEINIKYGTYYFSTLIERYNNIGLALAAYNAGMGKVDLWIESGIIKSDGSDLENIPYKETNLYVRKILNSYKIYQELY